MTTKITEEWLSKNRAIGAMLYQNYSRIRDEKGLNDYRVSKLTGINSGFFSVWKNKGSKPGFSKISAIANALNAPVADFYYGCEMTEYDPPNGTYRHGQKGTRLYEVWSNMKGRCNCKTDIGYPRYGGRGISVCNEWIDFAKFAEWANANGYVEDAKRGECTIDRIDNDGNYCPENCRWVNAKIQANNRRNNHVVEYCGNKYTIKQLSEKIWMKKSTLLKRLRRGWNLEDAVSKPLQIHNGWEYPKRGEKT